MWVSIGKVHGSQGKYWKCEESKAASDELNKKKRQRQHIKPWGPRTRGRRRRRSLGCPSPATWFYALPGIFCSAVDFPWLSSNVQHILWHSCTGPMLSNLWGTNISGEEFPAKQIKPVIVATLLIVIVAIRLIVIVAIIWILIVAITINSNSSYSINSNSSYYY